MHDAFNFVTDQGLAIDLRRCSPASVVANVRLSVWRWRWRLLEGRHPSLAAGNGGGGFGPLFTPILKLLSSKRREDWGPVQQGALRSAVTNRQWPQARLCGAGMASTPNCRLCVHFGFCLPSDTEWQHAGTLVHRLWTCPVLEAERQRCVPGWLRHEVSQALAERDDGTLLPADWLLFTRALTASPKSFIDPPPVDGTFKWTVPPPAGEPAVLGRFYSDGSLIDAHWQLDGSCARSGWAFAAVDTMGWAIAAAHGRPPSWAGGIHGAELWALLMAGQSAISGSQFRVDCLSVVTGAQRGATWATAPHRVLAQAWGPLAVTIEDAAQSVVWMLAHCTVAQVGAKRLGNGAVLSTLGRDANIHVDELAQSAARSGAVPREQRERAKKLWEKVSMLATWIGVATALASHFPAPGSLPGQDRVFLRDSDGQRSLGQGSARRSRKRKAAIPPAASCSPAVAPVHRSVRPRTVSWGGRCSSADAQSRWRLELVASTAAKRARADSDAHVQRRVAELSLHAAPGPSSASSRLAALQARVRARAAAGCSGAVAGDVSRDESGG